MQVPKEAIGRSIVTSRDANGWWAYYKEDPENRIFDRNREVALKKLQNPEPVEPPGPVVAKPKRGRKPKNEN